MFFLHFAVVYFGIIVYNKVSYCIFTVLECVFLEQIVYLDNSSTTKPCKEAIEQITLALQNTWGNPSSLHLLGVEAENAVTKARERAAELLGARADEIVFTGSGTEANNTALLTLLPSKKRGGRVIVTAIEHPSVLETAKRLENDGFEVIRLAPDQNGSVSLDTLEKALTGNTVLVSMMAVNNETGAILPVGEAATLVKRKMPRALFHCDAVQAFGKLPLSVRQTPVDMLTASAHKIHGPKGAGLLYIRKGTALHPLLTGGGQERGLRSGTESVPLIMGFYGAMGALGDLHKRLTAQKELWDHAKECLASIPAVTVNSPSDALPYILNISLPGYRSETLLHFLESRGIFVSSGSACAKGAGSHVLTAMGLDRALVDSALRLSFCRDNTKEEVDRLCEALSAAVDTLRKVHR